MNGIVILSMFLMIVICTPCILYCVQQIISSGLDKIMALPAQIVSAVQHINKEGGIVAHR